MNGWPTCAGVLPDNRTALGHRSLRDSPTVQVSDHNDRLGAFLRLATLVLVIVVLREGQEVLVPIAFAVLLAFLLSPLVVRLVRAGLPKAVAIVATVTLAFGVIGAIGWVVSSQAIGLVRELPKYEQNIQRKISAIKNPDTPGFIARMSGMVTNLRREIKAPSAEKLAAEQHSTDPKPVPVEVQPAEPTPWEVAGDIVRPFLRPLGVTGIVIVFVVAMLFQREDMRDRFMKLVSAGKLTVATQAVDDAANRVSRYLGMQLVVNALYGVPIGVGLYLIGVPNSLLWGLLATLLRFIPFLGPWIAAIFPLTLSIAVDPGWTMFLYTAALFVVMELISNNLIEVVLYGASTGISNLALLIAAVFWTWLWGPAGLVLSTPMTVCLLVLGNYVPGLNFLSMLLGSQPVLEPPAQFYQRMLSMESEDMLELAAKHIDEHSVDEFYANVFVPALLLSEVDRHSGTLPEVRQRFIFQASRELIEDLDRQDEASAVEASGDTAREEPRTFNEPPVVLAVAARDEADEIVGLMLAHLLRRRGVAAQALPLIAPVRDESVDRRALKIVVVSALPPSGVGAARHMVRRLRQEIPGTHVLVGVWEHTANLEKVRERLGSAHPDGVVSSLADAIIEIEKLLGRPASPPPAPTDAETHPLVAEKLRRNIPDDTSAPL